MIYCRVSQDKWNMSILSHLDLIFFFSPWLAFWQFSLFHSAVLCTQGRWGVELFPNPGSAVWRKPTAERVLSLWCIFQAWGAGSRGGERAPRPGNAPWHEDARESPRVETFSPDDGQDTDFLCPRSSWVCEILHIQFRWAAGRRPALSYEFRVLCLTSKWGHDVHLTPC